ncbi:Phomenoic acid biosynthesis cluster-specific transcriptional regulator-like protein [Cladobotryum mycophilum]|uniref:Phomenoic acid biosynthesis cluster-specific transcriptional regulator-like protein n=1 Tax=Cladobotryum mycophilum TaxID=491253 RepID=A0ABR0SU11_9HYPO
MAPQPAKTGLQCIECLRRRLTCDGSTPPCKVCRATGVACTGYGDGKQLTWLPLGRVSRLRESRTIASDPSSLFVEIGSKANKGEKKQQQQRDGKQKQEGKGPLVRKRRQPFFITSQRSQQRQLEEQYYMNMTIPNDPWPEEWDAAKLAQNYNSLTMIGLAHRQVLPETAKFTDLTFPVFQGMTPSARQCIAAMILGYRIMIASKRHNLDIQPAYSGPVSHLWSKFHHHIGFALRDLNDELRWHSSKSVIPLFLSIQALLGTTLYMYSKPQWRPHAAGFLTLLRHCGGLRQLMHAPLMARYSIAMTMIIFSLSNTTSPSDDQLSEVLDFDLDVMVAFYEWNLCPVFLGPTQLYLEVIRINRIRLQRVSEITDTVAPEESSICSLLLRLDGLSIEELTEGWPESEEYPLIAQIFRSAVVVFASLAVPCMLTTCRCAQIKKTYHDDLFHLLEAVVGHPVRPITVFWPLMVGGVAAQSGPRSERVLVEKHLSSIVQDSFILGASLLAALEVLRTFWASDKTEWDECFDKPYAFLG